MVTRLDHLHVRNRRGERYADDGVDDAEGLAPPIGQGAIVAVTCKEGGRSCNQ